MMRVAVAFEYPTVNGGENSMFAVLQWLLDDDACRDVEIVALCPPAGAVRERLDDLGIDVFPFDRHAEGAGTAFARQGAAAGQRETVAEQPGTEEGRQGTEAGQPKVLATFATGGRAHEAPSREAQIDALCAAVRTSQPDLLHANSLSMGRVLGAAASQLPCPTTAHLRDILKLSKAAIRDLNQNARLVAVSEATRAFHVAQGLKEERSRIVYNGVVVPAEREPRSVTRERIRSEFGIPADADVLLTVGQIGLRKGLDTLAAAASLLAGKGRSLHWLIAGERFSQKQESIDFERQVFAAFQRAAPRVTAHRLGYRNDVADLMLAANALVHGARQEPLGRVLLEAAALRLPIVATDVGGTREILTDGVSGLLVAKDEPEAMAAAIERLLDNPAERQQIADAAAVRVAQDFNVERSSQQLIALWRSVYAEKNSRPEM